MIRLESAIQQRPPEDARAETGLASSTIDAERETYELAREAIDDLLPDGWRR